jgi:phage terminase large subunit
MFVDQRAPAPLVIEPEFPAPLQCLFEPKRYKVLYGGRGAGRSWGVARALLLLGIKSSIRVLCAREFQNSIAESVHRVLSDQIALMGLDEFYHIEVARIKSKINGTVFGFEGIKNNTTRIKSFEGVDICWVEEAEAVTKDSWRILIPTIRKETCSNGHRLRAGQLQANEMKCPVCQEVVRQSEIWITFNPNLETDYTYQRFVANADPDRSFVIRMTYADNPWFPDVLRQEMEADRDLGLQPGHEQDYADYLTVWEGHCKQVLTGAVYARELLRATEEGRVCTVPWEREWPVDTFWDLGRADNTAIWFGQRVAMQYRWLSYYEASGQHISHFLQEMQHQGYTYGTCYLPHDAKAKRLGSKRTIEEQVRQAGYRVQIVPKLSLVDGINAARTIFPNSWFDEDGTRDGLLALRNYRYKVINDRLSNEPLHDWASDGADAFRYASIAMKMPREKSSLLSKLGIKPKREDLEFSGRPATAQANWLGR